MKIESNKNWTTCLRLNTGDGSPRVFLLNSHFLGSVPSETHRFFCRIPRYKLETAFIEGTVYRMVLDNNPEFKEFKYSLEMVSNVNKNLIFDKYAVAKEYSGYKDEEINNSKI